MAFDFPDVPVVDEVVTFGNTSYKWNLEKWMRLPKGAINMAVIHDASLTGDGTTAAPLSVDPVYLNGVISNSLIDAQGFVRSGIAGLRQRPAQPPGNQPSIDEALARINALEREIAVLRGRGSRPLSPIERAASRASRRRPQPTS